MKKIFVCLVSIGIALCCYSSISKAAESKVVKVAYFNMGEYYQCNEEHDSVRSYDVEYLKKIATYCKLKFQYVDCKTWSNALKMLREHKVDLVGTAQWNAKRDKVFEYCLENYGYTVGELATLPDKGIVYEDYQAIGKSVIGCTKEYVRMHELSTDFAANNISPEIKLYETQEELEKALENGEIDIIAANSHTLHNEWKVIEKFSYSPFFFMSYKGNHALTDLIDGAIIKLNLEEPEFDDRLLKEFFPNLTGTPLTKKELDYIAENHVLKMYFDAGTKPISWYNEKTGTMQGCFVDACQQINQLTGLKLDIERRTSKNQKSNIMFTTLYYDSQVDVSGQKGVTNALIKEPFNFYRHIGGTYRAESKESKIALVDNRSGLKKYIEEKYPQYKVTAYATPKECIEHLEADDVDLIFMNVHVADDMLTTLALEDIKELPVDEVEFGIGLRFFGKNATLLASIVNKGIQNLDTQALSDSMVKYALETAPNLSLSYFMKKHLGMVMIIVSTLAVVITLLIVFFLYAKTMRSQRDHIKQVDRDRSDFFARMSHDMRTPMNGIQGMIELSMESDNVGDIHSNMRKAKTSSEYMLSLINDTLDLQRLENGKLKIEPQIINQKQYFDDIVMMIGATAKKKDIEFKVQNINLDHDTFLWIDPIRVKQILINLLSNAIKFTNEGGTVECIMECEAIEGDIAHDRFTIRDNGIGMTEEFIQTKIYTPYTQEPNSMTDRYAGSGLGLAITKNLVDIMKGKIEVESSIGKGTTFAVSLDFQMVDKKRAQRERKETENDVQNAEMVLQDRKVLLCEDHPLNAEITRRLLEKVGVHVVWAENGEIGLRRYEDSELKEYDAVIMDIRMPVMNGIEATKAIRALSRKDAQSVPIIALTANTYDSDVSECKRAGMNAHLAKPIEPVKLYETLAEYMIK